MFTKDGMGEVISVFFCDFGIFPNQVEGCLAGKGVMTENEIAGNYF